MAVGAPVAFEAFERVSFEDVFQSEGVEEAAAGADHFERQSDVSHVFLLCKESGRLHFSTSPYPLTVTFPGLRRARSRGKLDNLRVHADQVVRLLRHLLKTPEWSGVGSGCDKISDLGCGGVIFGGIIGRKRFYMPTDWDDENAGKDESWLEPTEWDKAQREKKGQRRSKKVHPRITAHGTSEETFGREKINHQIVWHALKEVHDHNIETTEAAPHWRVFTDVDGADGVPRIVAARVWDVGGVEHVDVSLWDELSDKQKEACRAYRKKWNADHQ
jgi:hypothetical protein